MIQLANFPIFNQLASPVAPSDHQRDENASYNCVPTSLAMCIRWYDGKTVAPDDLKDATYGQGHVGGGDELRYGSLLASKYGLHLGFEPHRSGTTDITNAIRSYLRRGIPCIVTMQSDWNATWGHARFGGWHVGVAYAIDETDNGVLKVANPWRGFSHVRPVKDWAARLGIGVWPVSRIAAPVVTPQTSGQTSGLPTGWKDDGTTLTAPNGQPIIHGFRTYVLDRLKAGTWQGGNPYTPEWSGGTFSVQPFASTLLMWDATRNVYEGTMADALAIVAHEHQGKAA